MVDAKIALSVLLSLTQKFTSEETLEDILQAVVEATLRLLPGNHASVRVLDDERTELLCGARTGKGSEIQPMAFQPGEGVIGWVAEHGWVAHVQDTEVDRRFKGGPEQGFSVRSLVAVPLLSSGHVVGVLSISAEEPDAFTAEDEALTLLLANCTVPIIERARLERLALVDPLTQAYNDRYLLPRLRDELAQATQRSTPLCVMMLDVDNLSKFNQEHTFEHGDRLLQEIATRIRGCIAAPAKLIRRGGGTFVLILPQTSEPSAAEQAESLRAAVAGPEFDLGGEEAMSQTLSIGLAAWDGEERPLELLARADEAMKEAKRTGRDRVTQAEPPEVDEPD